MSLVNEHTARKAKVSQASQVSSRKENQQMVTTKKAPLSKLLSSTVLALVLALGSALPVFAAGGPNGSVEGTADNPAAAAITKILEMPVGTDTPKASFQFEVTPIEVDGSIDQTDLDAMPVIGTNGLVTIDLSTGATEVSEDGLKQVYKESLSLFEGVNWTHTGVYTYSITEVDDTYACSTSDPIEQMSYSGAVYQVSVYVDRADDGTLYARYIGALVVVPDTDSTEPGDKVDPTPGGDPSVNNDYSKMIFTNSYLKTNAPDNPDPTTDSVLIISKAVNGGALADPDEYFDFDIIITNAVTITDANKTYKAYIVDANGIVSPIPGNQAPSGAIKFDGTNDYIEFTTAQMARIQLKDGQQLSFVDLPVGTMFDVEEVNPKNYTASYVLTIDGAIKEAIDASAAGQSLGLSEPSYTGEGDNRAAFTNTYRDVTPMGIAVDNLPYIIMALIALLGLAGYVTSKTRTQS